MQENIVCETRLAKKKNFLKTCFHISFVVVLAFNLSYCVEKE